MLKSELYEIAQRLTIDGRSTMTKEELEEAVFSHPDIHKSELYQKAQEIELSGRSNMSKEELRQALVGPELTDEDYNDKGQVVLYRVEHNDETLGYCTTRHRPGIYTLLFFHGPDPDRQNLSPTNQQRYGDIMKVAPKDAVILDPPN